MIIDVGVSAHNLLSATHSDTTAASVARGAIITGQGSSAKWTLLAAPSVLSGLSHDGTDVSWVTATGTGAPVRATSPTFITPLLGTPTSGVLTNCTGLPEAGLSLADVTTANVSATAHGFAPKFPNNTTTFLRGDGTYAAPSSSGMTSIATTSPISGGTITTTGTLSLLVNVDHAFTAAQSIANPGIAVTSTDGLTLQNTTAATSGATVQQSPRLRFRSQVWNTTSVAATNTNDFFIESVPVSAATPSGLLKFGSSLNGASATYPMTLTSSSTVQLRNSSGFGLNLDTQGTSVTYSIQNATTSLRMLNAASTAWAFVSVLKLGIDSANPIQWGSFGGETSPDTFLYRGGAAVVQLGADVNGAAVSQTIQAANGITGTDKTGGNLTLASGKGTGAGAVSQLLLQTPTVLSTGTTAQSLTTRLTVDVNGIKATGYLSSDGSAGVTAGPFTAITAITVKNGLVTAITGT